MSAQLPAPLIARSREAVWVALDYALAAFLLALAVDGAASRPANFGVPTWLSMAAAVLVAAPAAVAGRRVRVRAGREHGARRGGRG